MTTEVLDECKEHFNEIVLMSTEVVRLIGYSEDAYDCYYVIKDIRGKIIHHSAVGGIYFLTFLKEQGKVTAHNGEQWSDYTRIETILSLNGCPPEKEFYCKIDPTDTSVFNAYMGIEE